MSRDAAWRDESEIARFNAMARQWWDPNGPMKPLHRLNPTRLSFFRSEAARHFGRDTRACGPSRG